MINLDANASYGLLPEVKSEIQAEFDFLNPSSVHFAGQKARAVIEQARDNILDLLDARGKADVVFTSGATEANNTILMSVIWNKLNQDFAERRQYSIVHSEFEHPCITETIERIAGFGINVRRIKPSEKTKYQDSDILNSLQDTKLLLCSLMFANNETGLIYDFSSAVKALKNKFPEAIFHSDVAQAVGRVNFSFESLGADCLTISGHKLGALPGVGALVIKKGLYLDSLILGGPQEKRRRAGTENTLAIHSLGLASKLIKNSLDSRISTFQDKKALFVELLKTKLPFAKVNFENSYCLPNTVSLTVPGVAASDLVIAMDVQGVLISAGSACSSGKPMASKVLIAAGVNQEDAKSTVRLSFQSDIENHHLEVAVDKLSNVINRLKN